MLCLGTGSINIMIADNFYATDNGLTINNIENNPRLLYRQRQGNWEVVAIGNTLPISSDAITHDYLVFNTDIYSNNSLTNVLYESNFISTPQNTITLTATSNHKFGFNDKNQLQVNIDGDWSIEDFSFYIQKYINNEWTNYTDFNDYYRLINYSNPYYIFWPNINYFPIGTYRYMADFGSMGESLYYSEQFQITNSIINNSASGTIDNGNIDINIDTGETVDNIKDFLGQDSTVTEEELKNSFPEVQVNDPTEDFFSWVFSQIENIFTSNESQSFTFSLFTDTTYTINSSQISIPNSPLKLLISASVDFGICYFILIDIHRTIEKVKKGSFEDIADEDITANML